MNSPKDLAIPQTSVNLDKRAPHPQADRIREKIDYYFSDENLGRDGRLLTAINKKGPNSSVNVFQVNSRLRHIIEPKPSTWQIIDACKGSKMVDVVDKDHIRRKVPFVCEESDGEKDGGLGSRGAAGMRTGGRLLLKPIPAHPGVKAGTYKKSAATGFEAGFVGAPMTPQEYEEERELYHIDNDITTRLGSAIERFCARRKFTSTHQKAFTSFLRYGGVYKANRIGQGESKKAIMNDEELSKEEKIEMCAVYDVDVDDKLEAGKWTVDFQGVCAGYLSTDFAEDLDEDLGADDKIDNQCNVLHSFYHYLLYHDVCPEHKTDIQAALKITDKARLELTAIQHLSIQLPTPFSKACSVLFGGDWHTIFGMNTGWGDFDQNDNPEMSKSDAKIVFGAALMSLAPDAIFEAAFPDGSTEVTTSSLRFAERRSITVEVVAIEPATNETRTFYKGSGIEDKEIKAGPVGKLICKGWDMPSADEYDIPPHLSVKAAHDQTYEFWIEDSILSSCFLGMKIRGSTCLLATTDTAAWPNAENSVWILDSVSRLYCSFTSCLENELCTGKWREPEWYSEGAMLGCEHDCAMRGREMLEIMKRERREKEERGEWDEGDLSSADTDVIGGTGEVAKA